MCGWWRGGSQGRTLRTALSHLLPWVFDLGPSAFQGMWVIVGRGIKEDSSRTVESWRMLCTGAFLSLWLQFPMLKRLQRVTFPPFIEP